MMTDLYTSTFYMSVVSCFLPIGFFFLRRKHHAKHHQIILAILLLSVLSDLTILILTGNNLPSILITNIYTILEFILLNIFYYHLVFQKQRKAYLYVTSLVFLLSLVYSTATQGLLQINNYLWAVSSIILSLHSILYFYVLPQMAIERYIDKHLFSNGMLNASLSIYFFTSIIIFILMDFVFTNLTADQAKGFWSIYNIINIIKNLGIASAFFLSGKRKPYISLSHLEKMKE